MLDVKTVSIQQGVIYEVYLCGDCGYLLGRGKIEFDKIDKHEIDEWNFCPRCGAEL